MLWDDARTQLIKYNGRQKEEAKRTLGSVSCFQNTRQDDSCHRSNLWSLSPSTVCTCSTQLAPSANSFVSLRLPASCFVKCKVFQSRWGRSHSSVEGGPLWIFHLGEPQQTHISWQHATCDPALTWSRRKTCRPSVLFKLLVFLGIRSLVVHSYCIFKVKGQGWLVMNIWLF